MAQGTDNDSINKELVREIDLTGNGSNGKVILHLSAKNFMSPFTWKLSVISEGQEVYSYGSNDTKIDKFFKDDGYVEDCNDYKSCKKSLLRRI